MKNEMHGDETPSGTVRLSPRKLEHARLRRGLTHDKIARETGVSRNTVGNAFRGRPVYCDTAHRIAEALRVDATELFEDTAARVEPPALVSGQWRVAAPLGPWITASNGLQFRLHRMTHAFLAGRQGRGKCYDVAHLSDSGRAALREQLLRHPTVCERIGVHAHVAENLSTQPEADGQTWWVMDRWVEGRPLSERLAAGAMAGSALARLMTEIALGLNALHEAQVVFRELAPSRVWLAEGDGRVVLTEFELAKLLDTGATVSAAWPEDAYRAPEVEGGQTSIPSDLYSWARLFVHAAAGALPAAGEELAALQRLPLPKAVWGLVRDCLAPRPGDRPQTIGQVLKTLERHWRVEDRRSA